MSSVERHQEWIAALVAGLVSGAAIATSWRFAPAKDIWDVATAIGTVGATCAAVLIAIAGSWAKRREQLEAAHLAAARVSVHIQHSIDAVTAAQGWLAFYTEEAHVHGDGFQTFSRNLDDARLDISPSDFHALVPLPRRCAHRLARASALLNVLRSDIERRQHFFGRQRIQFDVYGAQRATSVASWRGTVASILNLLLVAYRECANATQLGAPLPNAVEVYGVPVDLE